MDAEQIRKGLSALRPDVPWANYYDLGYGIDTVLPQAGRFYGKAMGLKEFTNLLPSIIRGYMHRSSFGGMRCLDLGSAEGLHAIAMAEGGAREVIGLDGRQLYVDRANFVARVKGLNNVKFERADVRKLDAGKLGQFDFVLCSGLLHHLNAEAFEGFTQALCDVTGDTLLLYTHVSSEWTATKFKLKPSGTVGGKYRGYLFQEHLEDTTQQQRTDQVRASLDNVYSFWATEESLIERFVDVGFKSIIKLYEPVFVKTYKERIFRGIWILRKTAP